MSVPLKINLSGPITSVKIVENHKASNNNDSSLDRSDDERDLHQQTDTGQISIQELKAGKAAFVQACQTLNSVTDKLNQFCTQLFSEHKKEIAGLSVEIARKILVQKIENGDYKIESIVQEALNNAPTHQDIVIHLNPEDLANCQKAQQDEPGGAFAGIKFVPDSKIGRAECLLESSQGIVESLINEQLDKISKALQKVE
jgi:flagellar biosynthesis/type III secretory pathway protein FliH